MVLGASPRSAERSSSGGDVSDTYQIVARRLSGRTIPSPWAQWNAAANSRRFASGRINRHSAGACGCTVTWLRTYWLVDWDRQIWAHARKKRCSGIKQSMPGGRGL